MMRRVWAGAVAGAAGTTALNTVTYLDMVVRGRAGSSVPKDVVDRLSDRTHVPVPGVAEARENRASATGALLGLLTGVGVGALYGASRALPWRPALPLTAPATGAGAMAGADVPPALLKVSDPRTGRPADWPADLVPHPVYGAVTAVACELTAG
ncbi:hypothetical protein ITI46_18190 [Streptomyces oryzae]|uniref:Uncharacterized protein n=1 Tax=Streptomyces oryzae TaxID=1434886 RepID=A0ABS3XDV2_9ACTN|nr:hypothetical protein [Streptomyces oryzae]MBO8193575.1 hypothetical protein [Streptomyces oryzae]